MELKQKLISMVWDNPYISDISQAVFVEIIKVAKIDNKNLISEISPRQIGRNLNISDKQARYRIKKLINSRFLILKEGGCGRFKPNVYIITKRVLGKGEVA